MNRIDLAFPYDTPPERLDHFVAGAVSGLSRAAVQRLIETGDVSVNGAAAKPSLKLKGGERIVVALPPPEAGEASPQEIPLDVLYEDRDIIVVNKPAGMVVHPGAGNPAGTLVNALLAHCADLSGIGGKIRPGIVHRIDKDTSGVIIAAKNDHAHLSLARQFSEHTIKRIYLALVHGSPKTDSGRIESTIGRHPVDRTKMSSKARHGKHAATHWKVIERYEGVTLVRLRLETGRTHQIRVHLSEAGHPLVGDLTYGSTGRITSIRNPLIRALLKTMTRQALHAKILGFIHPTTGGYLEFDTELPDDMAQLLAGLAKFQSHN